MGTATGQRHLRRLQGLGAGWWCGGTWAWCTGCDASRVAPRSSSPGPALRWRKGAGPERNCCNQPALAAFAAEIKSEAALTCRPCSGVLRDTTNALGTDQPTPHVKQAAFTIAAGSSWEPASPTAAGLYPQTVKSEQSSEFVKSPCKAQCGLRHGSTKAIYSFIGESSCLGLP